MANSFERSAAAVKSSSAGWSMKSSVACGTPPTSAMSTRTLDAPARPQPSSSTADGSAPSHCRSALGASCATHHGSRSARIASTACGASSKASTMA